MSKYAVFTEADKAKCWPRYEAWIDRNVRDYKVAATIASNWVANNLKGWSYTGKPNWGESVTIVDDTYQEVAKVTSQGAEYPEVIGRSAQYPEVAYIIAAVQNMMHTIAAMGDEWMTPAEIERRLALKRGTVRQYIGRHREELQSMNAVKQADDRTLLMRAGKAWNVWQKQDVK